MKVRESTLEDTSQIIGLLKQSIGEALTPKTEDYFLWKHEKNPFGRSKVLLAEEDGKIVGLRAFMLWRWVSKDENILAARAVDTATDPAFQGKGIFKKLTLQAVDECKAAGIGLVFNSPNPVSMAGYMKMGWSTAGRLPISVGIGSILPRLFAAEKLLGFYDRFPADNAINALKKDWAVPVSGKGLLTPLSYNYLAWRYRDCPVAKYGAVIEPGKFGFVFRLKRLNRFIELRICEAWTESETSVEEARKAFKKVVQSIRPALLTCGSTPLFSENKKIATFFGPFKKGPVITIRPLAMTNLNNFEEFNLWQPSLGSMELF